MSDQSPSRDLLRHLLRTQEDERHRLARILHDTVSQDLAAISIAISLLAREPGLSAAARASMATCEEAAARALAGVKRLSHGLCPPLLHDVGVDNALAWYAERVLQYHGVTVALELEGDVGKLARERESALYRVVEDVLGEVTARPDYAHARVYLQAEEEAITLQVARTFNDPGTKPAVAPWLPALLAERMQAVGGSARLMQDEHGLTAIARLPLAEAAR